MSLISSKTRPKVLKFARQAGAPLQNCRELKRYFLLTFHQIPLSLFPLESALMDFERL